MNKTMISAVAAVLCSVGPMAAGAAEPAKAADEAAKPPTALSFTMKSLDGQDVKLSKYQGKVVLVVNVASKCGLTPQYAQLQALHEKYAKQGLAIVAFPCNQFGGQEPGTADEIREFCSARYSIAFDLFAKIEVNGDGACPLYKHLTALQAQPKGAGAIQWNFEKFVIGRDGTVVARFAPKTKPDDPEVIKTLEAELAKKIADWHIRELETRRATAEAHPEDAIPWEVVKARLARPQ
jgi:glutathione peroxidase